MLLVCAVLMLLLNMTHVLNHEDAGAAQAASDQRLEHKLKLLMKQSSQMDETLTRLLEATEALQQGSDEPQEAAEHSTAAAAPPKRRRKRRASAAQPKAAEASAAEAADVAQCPDRRPYHTVLTATGSNYQQWQARIMYHHWKKQSAAGGPCTDMAAFTRLCATRGGVPDGLQGEIPTLFTVELSAEVLSSHFGFGVLNRPNSVKQLMESATLLKEIRKTSDYVLILETDHVIMKPIPNLATPTTPAAYIFGYMYPQRSQEWVIKKYWPEGSYDKVQPVGPSPVLIHLDQLKAVYQRWLDFSMDLRSNSQAEAVIQGWVQEMWGYSIAAASLGITHRLIEDFQVEPGALSTRAQLRDFSSRYYIFHYTYQFEYMLDGTPCQPWNIGEWSLDKRHFNDFHPAYPLPQPPSGANEAGIWLLNAWNEAMGAIPSWPKRQPPEGSEEPPVQTLYGRRRLDWFSRHQNGFQQELQKNSLVRQVHGKRYSCTPTAPGSAAAGTLELGDSGDATLGRSRRGRWGAMNDPTIGADVCPVNSCLFVDLGGQVLNAHVDGSSLTIYHNHYRSRSAAERARPEWRCSEA